MSDTGLFLPILIIACIVISLGVTLLERWLNPSETETYEKWLQKEFESNPDYVNWLKHANGGKDYKLGVRVFEKMKRDESNSYYKWIKRMRNYLKEVKL